MFAVSVETIEGLITWKYFRSAILFPINGSFFQAGKYSFTKDLFSVYSVIYKKTQTNPIKKQQEKCEADILKKKVKNLFKDQVIPFISAILCVDRIEFLVTLKRKWKSYQG